MSEDASLPTSDVPATDAATRPRDVTLQLSRALGVSPIWLGLGTLLAYLLLWAASGSVIVALGGVPGWSTGWPRIRVALGVGSWLGGAPVERLLGAILG